MENTLFTERERELFTATEKKLIENNDLGGLLKYWQEKKALYLKRNGINPYK